MSKIYEALKQAEQDRSEAQRKALSALLARFTADRDALLAAVQDCQQQLATLTARVEGGPPGTWSGLPESLARLEEEQRRLAAALPAREVLASVERLVAERERQANELRRYHDDLAALSARLQDLQSSLGQLPEQLDDLRGRQVLYEARLEATAREAAQVAGELRSRGADRADPAAMERIKAEQELMTGALSALQDQVVTLSGQLRALDVAASARAEDVRAQIDELIQAQSLASPSPPPEWAATLAEIQALRARVEELSGGGRAAASDADLESQLRQCQADLEALGQRIDEINLDALPQLQILRQQLIQLRDAQETLQRDAQALLQEALERGEETSGRLDALAGEAARGAELVDVVRRLALDEQATRTELRSSQEQLQGWIHRIESAQAALAPQVDGLRLQIEAMQDGLGRTERHTTEAVAQALARAQDALRRVDALAGDERAQREEMGARLRQLSEAQETLVAAVAQYRDDVAQMLGRLDSAHQEQLRAFETKLIKLETAESAGGQAAAIAERALAQAAEAVRRAEEIAATQEQHRGDVAQQLAQLLEARDAVQATTTQLAEHVRALTVHLAEAPAAGVTADVVRQTIERLQEAQHQTAAQAEQAVARLRQELVEVSRQLDTFRAQERAREQRFDALEVAQTQTQRELAAQAQRLQHAGERLDTLQHTADTALASLRQEVVDWQRKHGGGFERLSEKVAGLDGALSILRERLEEIAASGGQSSSQLTAALNELRQQSQSALAELRQHLGEITQQTQTTLGAHVPLLAQMQAALHELRGLHEQASAEIRGIAETARARAADALQRINDVARRQQELEIAADDRLASQAQIDAAIRGYQADIATLAAELKSHTQEAAHQWARRDDLRAKIEDLAEHVDQGAAAVANLAQRVADAERRQAQEQQRWSADLAELRASLAQQTTQSAAEAVQARVAELEARLRTLGDAGDERWEELRVALDGLAERLTGAEQESAQTAGHWKQESAHLRSALQRLESAVTEARSRALPEGWHELIASVETISARLNALERERSEAEDRWHATFSGLSDQLDSQRAEVAEVRDGLTGVIDEQSRLRQLGELARAAQAKAEDALRRIEVLDGAQATSLDVLRQQIAALKQEHGTLHAELTELSHAQLPVVDGELQAEMAALRREQAEQAARLEAKAAAALERVAALGRDLQQLDTERLHRDQELSTVLSGLADERDGVKRAVAAQAAELGRLVQNLAESPDREVVARLQEQMAGLEDAMAALRQAQNAGREGTLQLDTALTERTATLRSEVETLQGELASLSGRLAEEVQSARAQLASLRSAVQHERDERQATETQTSEALRALSDRVTEAIEVMERAAAQAAVTPVTPAPATPVEAIVDGFGRLEARLDQWLGSATQARREPVVPPRRPLWPVWLLAGFGLLTTVSGLYALLGREPAPLSAAHPVNRPVESNDPAVAAQFARGLEALQQGDVEAAERAFRAVIAVRPDAIEARNNLAVVLAEQRRLDAAVEQLHEALRIRPDYERAQANLTRLERLRDSSSSRVSRSTPGPALAAAPAGSASLAAPSSARPPVVSEGTPITASAGNDRPSGCTLQPDQQRVCCGAGVGETCFALAPTPARQARAQVKAKPKAKVDIDDLDLLYDLP
jgi:chromosome segregation ATPase